MALYAEKRQRSIGVSIGSGADGQDQPQSISLLWKHFLQKAYRYFREVAAATVGLFFDLGLGIKNLWQKVEGRVAGAIGKVGRVFLRAVRRGKKIVENVRRSARAVKETYRSHRATRGILVSGFHATKVGAAGVIRARAFRTFLCYLVPLVMLSAVATQIYYATGVTYAVSVNYNGRDVGYITDESVFEAAESIMQERIVYVDGNETIDLAPTFSVGVVNEQDLISETQLADNMIAVSSMDITRAIGLYVDDVFYGAVVDTTAVQAELDAKLAAYRDEADESATVSFVQDVELIEGLYLTDGVISDEKIVETINTSPAEERTYTIEDGDIPLAIAEKNVMTYSELLALNPGIEENCQAGTQIVVCRGQPLISVKVTKTLVYEEEVPYPSTELVDNDKIKGYEAITQEGVTGINLIVAQADYIDGVEVNRTIVSTEVIREMVEEKVTVGGADPVVNIPSSSTVSSRGVLLWPVNGGYISSYMGDGRGHNGLDIAAPAGTAIYAAMEGTVTLARTNSGYGKCVIIQHPNGMTTLYGHASQLYVSAGEYVTRGQAIAAVGQTGWATGNHVHFEARVNGSIVNPQNYM